jgi:hypothetical protein
MNANNWNGKERRSGADRRQGERRTPPQQSEGGVLSTRKGERRQSPRRKTDREKPGSEESGGK